ncbi:DUF805 domain-containing protein [Streptomyces sp. BR123]|uniref:DUF805 domain-containing protein n=1 Tax=Streptomyces sp. BR123 TaxID=2749828 RepID=UPI0015C4A4F7|nr:DUF805 domain-containing protein [Streptomyces sp. BR123]NXY95183.1 DUF805 domain-containing protein [Streptomyces sp. BR123]
MHHYTDVLKKYAVFSGRARRQEFWMFFLLNMAVAIVVAIVDAVIGANMVLYGIYVVAIIVPTLALSVRRLHDLGKSGWWYFICLVPLIGSIWLLVLFATEGQPQPNQYGPNPKALQA